MLCYKISPFDDTPGSILKRSLFLTDDAMAHIHSLNLMICEEMPTIFTVERAWLHAHNDGDVVHDDDDDDVVYTCSRFSLIRSSSYAFFAFSAHQTSVAVVEAVVTALCSD